MPYLPIPGLNVDTGGFEQGPSLASSSPLRRLRLKRGTEDNDALTAADLGPTYAPGAGDMEPELTSPENTMPAAPAAATPSFAPPRRMLLRDAINQPQRPTPIGQLDTTPAGMEGSGDPDPVPDWVRQSANDDLREQYASLKTPVPQSAGGWRSVLAGVLSASPWSRPTAQLQQSLKYPGYADQLRQFNAQKSDLERQIAMQQGALSDQEKQAQIDETRARAGLLQKQTDQYGYSNLMDMLSKGAVLEDQEPKLTSPEAAAEPEAAKHAGSHIAAPGIPGKQLYIPTPAEVAEQRKIGEQAGWLQVPKPLQDQYGLPPKAPYQAIDAALRAMEAAGRAKDANDLRRDLANQADQTRRDIAAESNATRRDLAAATSANKDSARADASYKFNVGELDKIEKPIADSLMRLGRLHDTINQMTPQADALLAPELLTVMAGGQGSGLRMNEAEISRIVGGRSNWESLKAALNKWQLDPNKALSVTPAQRKQMRDLVRTVGDKLQAKQQLINSANESLVESDDPKEHRRIVTKARQALAAIDQGQQPQQGQGQQQPQVGQQPGTIRVRRKSDGQTGTIPASSFDASKYDKL